MLRKIRGCSSCSVIAIFGTPQKLREVEIQIEATLSVSFGRISICLLRQQLQVRTLAVE